MSDMPDVLYSDDMDVQKAQLGIEADAFKRTNLGRFLIDRAGVEIDQQIQLLKEADPDDVKLNRDIRMRIKVAEQFQTWMDEAIRAGLEAERRINAEEAYDD